MGEGVFDISEFVDFKVFLEFGELLLCLIKFGDLIIFIFGDLGFFSIFKLFCELARLASLNTNENIFVFNTPNNL
jgi:hypothetical protein